jgi:hypothetical protein
MVEGQLDKRCCDGDFSARHLRRPELSPPITIRYNPNPQDRPHTGLGSPQSYSELHVVQLQMHTLRTLFANQSMGF